MKRFVVAGFITCMLLMVMSSCSAAGEQSEKSNIIYGQVVKTDEASVTVETGKLKDNNEFKGDGENAVFDLPENVFYDDFTSGDVVVILVDGEDAVSISKAKRSDDGVAAMSSQMHPSHVAIATIANEKRELYDRNYAAEGNDKGAVLVTDAGGKLIADRIVASTEGKRSAAVCTAGGGQITASQMSIGTSGSDSPALDTYDSRSNIEIDGADITTEGSDSPCVFSTGNISLVNAVCVSEKSPVTVANEGGVINLKNCEATAKNDALLDIYCDSSRTRKQEAAKFMATDSALSTEGKEPFVKVRGTSGLIKFVNSKLSMGGDVLAEVKVNEQSIGGELLLYGVNQSFEGNIICDKKSKAKLVLTEGSDFTGVMNSLNKAGYSKVCLSKDSIWNMTGDSYVSSVENGDTTCSNINSNGYNIYYNPRSVVNKWIKGVIELPGGGRLIPADQK